MTCARTCAPVPIISHASGDGDGDGDTFVAWSVAFGAEMHRYQPAQRAKNVIIESQNVFEIFFVANTHTCTLRGSHASTVSRFLLHSASVWCASPPNACLFAHMMACAPLACTVSRSMCAANVSHVRAPTRTHTLFMCWAQCVCVCARVCLCWCACVNICVVFDTLCFCKSHIRGRVCGTGGGGGKTSSAATAARRF